MKTVIIGDIHGRTIWKDIVAQEKEFDKFVFIGDYVDTHENTTGEQQLANLLDIIEFKKSNPDKVILLFGNHDYHYLDVNERYSGYQRGYSYTFKKVYEDNIKLFQMCYQIPNTKIICSHAGISKVWLENHKFFELSDNNNLEQFVNDCFTFKPLSFKFVGDDPYGDSSVSSPIWIREHALSYSKYSIYTYIVGHTIKEKLRQMGRWISNHDGFKVDDPNIWMIDTLGTSKEYLVVDDNKFLIKSVL